jgi:hypothetical protein
MCPEPIQTLKSEPTSQERGATSNRLEQTTAKTALPLERPKHPLERPKHRPNILPKMPTPDMRTATLQARLVKAIAPKLPEFQCRVFGDDPVPRCARPAPPTHTIESGAAAAAPAPNPNSGSGDGGQQAAPAGRSDCGSLC